MDGQYHYPGSYKRSTQYETPRDASHPRGSALEEGEFHTKRSKSHPTPTSSHHIMSHDESGGSGGPGGLPTPSHSAGGWVWRPDLPNPNTGGYGTWVWQQQQQQHPPPTMPPPPTTYSMYPTHPPPSYYPSAQQIPTTQYQPPFPGMSSSTMPPGQAPHPTARHHASSALYGGPSGGYQQQYQDQVPPPMPPGSGGLYSFPEQQHHGLVSLGNSAKDPPYESTMRGNYYAPPPPPGEHRLSRETSPASQTTEQHYFVQQSRVSGGAPARGAYRRSQLTSMSRREPYTRRPPGSGSGSGQGGMAGERSSFQAAAIALNKRMTSATRYQEILDIVEYDNDKFDTVCLATAAHKLATMRGAPNLHQLITTAPEFHKLKHLILQRHAELQTRNISNILWAMAKMNHFPGEEFMSTMSKEVVTKALQGNAQNVANLIWSFGTLNYDPGKETLQALEDALIQKLPEFTSQNISNSVLAFAKLEYIPAKHTLDALADESRKKIRTFTPQALSNTLWGLSKLGIVGNEEFLQIIAKEAVHNVAEFNSQNLANAVWAFATIGVRPVDVFLKVFAEESIRKISEFSPQNISNILWAYAKLGYECPALFEAADKQGTVIMMNFLPQAVSNALWAHATASLPPASIFYLKALAQAHKHLHAFTPQNLANTSWALATMRDMDPVKTSEHTMELIEAIASEVATRLEDSDLSEGFSRQHLANLVWSWAALGYDAGSKTLMALADALVARAGECNSQEIANSLWAFANLGVYHGPLYDSMCSEACQRLDTFNEHNMTNLLVSLARSTHYHEPLMVCIADAAVSSPEEFSNFHFVRLLWAFAFFNFSTPNFNPKMAQEFERRCESLESERFAFPLLSLLGWSFAILDAFTPELWDRYQLELVQSYHAYLVDSQVADSNPKESTSALNGKKKSFVSTGEQQDAAELGEDIERPTSSINQVFQAWMIVSAKHPDQSWRVDPELLEKGRLSWTETVKDVVISKLHNEVSLVLSAMGMKHSIEYFTSDGLFSIDIALPDEMIAIEVDGPSHFSKNGMRPLANLYIRKTLLEARGWRVVSVPFYHWSLGESEDEKKAFLASLLQDARSQDGPMAHPTTLWKSTQYEALERGLAEVKEDGDKKESHETKASAEDSKMEDELIPSSGEKENQKK